MNKTNEQNAQSGIYGSKCCGYEIALSKAKTFPPCKTCKAAATWILKHTICR
jgi:hypothetical protein